MSVNDWNYFGARCLEDAEVKQILPRYKSIYDGIENVRQLARERRESNARVNNTYSILAGRGMGKTSILLTIQKTLNQSSGNALKRPLFDNIVLDLIDPSLIERHVDLMGAVLGQMKRKLDDFLDKIRKSNWSVEEQEESGFFHHCIYKENNSLKKLFDELIEYYLYSHEDYNRILTESYSDLNSYMQKTMQMLSGSIGLQSKFSEFIKLWIEKIVEYQKNEFPESERGEPLLIFFFDDVDLCPNKIVELIKLINHYLCHPNIVTFVAGEKDEMERVLSTYFYLERKNIVDSKNLLADVGEEDRDKRLANNTLAKMLPSPNRKYLNQWTDRTKHEIKLVIDTNGDKKVDEKELGEVLQEIIKKIDEENDEEIFSYTTYFSDHKYEDKYVQQAFSIFSTQTRQLYYELNAAYELLDILTKNSKDESAVSDKEIAYKKVQLLENIFIALREEELLSNISLQFSDLIMWNENEQDNQEDVIIMMDNIKELICPSDKEKNEIRNEELTRWYYYLYFGLLLFSEKEKMSELKELYYRSLFDRDNTFHSSDLKDYVQEILVKSDISFGLHMVELLMQEKDKYIESETVESKENVIISIFMETVKLHGGFQIEKELLIKKPQFLKHIRNIYETKFCSTLKQYICIRKSGLQVGIESLSNNLANTLKEYNLYFLEERIVLYYKENVKVVAELLKEHRFIGELNESPEEDKQFLQGILKEKIHQIKIDNHFNCENIIKRQVQVLEQKNDIKIFEVLEQYRKNYENEVTSYIVNECFKLEGNAVKIKLPNDVKQKYCAFLDKYEMSVSEKVLDEFLSIREFTKASRLEQIFFDENVDNTWSEEIKPLLRKAEIHLPYYEMQRRLFGTPLEIYLLAQEYLKYSPEEDVGKELLRNWLSYVEKN